MNARCSTCGKPVLDRTLILSPWEDGTIESRRLFDVQLSGLTVGTVQWKLKRRVCPLCMMVACFNQCIKQHLGAGHGKSV